MHGYHVYSRRRRVLTVPLLLAALLLMGVSLTAGAKTTLVVMDWQVGSTAATQAWFQQAKERFEAAHPGVEIEYMTMSFGNSYREKLIVGAAAGTAPDAAALSIIWARDLWNAGILLDLNPLVDRTPELHPRNFIPATQLYNQVDGSVYGITHAMDESVLWYNCDAFEQSGLSTDPYALKSWSDLLTALKKLTVVDSAGVTTRYGLHSDMHTEIYSTWLTANGGSFYRDNLTRSGFGSKEGWEAAEFIVKLRQDGLIGGKFAGRTAAMHHGQNSTPYRLDRDDPDLNYQGTSFPPGPSGKGRATTVWGNMYSIIKSSKNVDLAWEFIRYYTGLQGNVDIFEALDYINSPRLDFYRSRQWVSARSRRKWMPMIPEIAYVGGVYPFLEYTKLNQQVWSPLVNRALAGTLPVESTFAQAAELYDGILARMTGQ
jgi:ABC-type glycerol-3-phosphate transport system substrate-binding protein